MTARLAIIVAYTVGVCVVLGSLIMQGVITLPDWVLWGILIAAGNLIYTKIRHGSQTETISLTMAMILLAVLYLSWPEIALATLLGVGIGNLLLSDAEWYKRLYNTVAISGAAVGTEVIYYLSGDKDTIMSLIGAAIVFDVFLFTLLAPVWYWIGGQTLREINRSYWKTAFIVPLSAGLALGMYYAAAAGPIGIYLFVILLLMVMRPEYNLTRNRHAVS